MRYALLVVTVAAALVVSPAYAGNGNGQDKKAPAAPSDSQTAIVSGPTPIDPSSVPSEGTGGAVVARTGALPAATTTSCGACIVTCWYATSRSGPSDWSGHVYIYQHLTWCGQRLQALRRIHCVAGHRIGFGGADAQAASNDRTSVYADVE